MNAYNTERALFAANALVYLAIAFGTLSFWSDAITAGGAIDYLVAALLTVANMAVSFLLSGVVVRFAEAGEKDAPVTRWMAVGLGAVLVFLEAGMTHAGLVWLNQHHPLAPDLVLTIAAFGLSVLNCLGLYVFGRELKRKEAPSPGKVLAHMRWGKAA